MIKALTVVAVLALSGSVFAQAGDQGTSGSVTKVGNIHCPVMPDEPIGDKPKTVVYKGQEVSLCCKKCVKKFNEDPEGYLKKAQEDAKKK